MPRKVQPKEYKSWPEQTRPHYIRLFSLQERLRAHLKMAQELAVRNYRLKYDTNPRKTNPIRIVGRQDDYLRRYVEWRRVATSSTFVENIYSNPDVVFRRK